MGLWKEPQQDGRSPSIGGGSQSECEHRARGAYEPHLSHDHVLALLDVLPLRLDDGVQKVEVLDVSPVGGQAVDEVTQHPLRDLTAQLVVIIEDVLHSLRLQQLHTAINITYLLHDTLYITYDI